MSKIKGLLSAPIFEGEEKTRAARQLNDLLLICLVNAIGYLAAVPILFPYLINRLIIVGAVPLLILGMLYFLRQGYIRIVGISLVALLWLIMTIASVNGGGVRTVGYTGYMIPILTAGFLLGWRAGMGLAGLSMLTGLAMLYAENSAMLTYISDYNSTNIWLVQSMFTLIVVALVCLATQSIEDALRNARRSESKYRSLVEHASDGIFVANAQGKYLEVNTCGAAMLGFNREELLERSIVDVISPESLTARPLKLDELAAGKTQVIERDLCHKNGDRFPAEISAKALPDGNLLGIVRDITERRRVERENQRRLKEISALYRVSQELRYLHDSEALAQEIIHILETVLEYQYGDVLLRDDDSDRLIPFAISDQKQGDAFIEVDQDYILSKEPRLGLGITGWVAQTGESICTGNVFEHEHYYALRENIRSELCVPLRLDEQIIGVVNVESEQANAYTESDLHLLEAVAAQMAASIRNTYLLEKLRASEQTLANLLSNLPGMAYRCRNERDWTMEFVSQGCLELTGYNPDDLIGSQMLPYAHLIHPDDREQVWDSVQDALREKKPFRLTYRITQRNGEEKWVWEQGIGIDSGEGEVLIVEGLVMDITESKQVEFALHESEQRYRLLIDQSPYAIAVHQAGKLVFVNPAAVALMRAKDGEELIGKPIDDIIHPETLDAARDRIGRMLNGEKGLYPTEDRYVRLDGSEIPVEVSASPFTLGGRPAIQVIALDITERKRAEEEVKRRTDHIARLHQANLALTQSLDLDTILRQFLKLLKDLVHYDSANIMLLEDETRVQVRAVHGYEGWADPAETKSISFSIQDTPLIRRIVAETETVLIPDTRQEPDWQRVAGAEHVLNWFGIPLITGGKVIGLFSVDMHTPGFFTKTDVELAETLSAQAATAIHNAILYREAQIHEQNLRHLSQQILSAQEEERRRLSRELHDEAGQALTALKISLDIARADIVSEDEAVHERLFKASEMISQTIDHIRLLARNLRPPALDAVSLNAVLSEYCQSLNETTGVVVEWVGTELPALSDLVQVTLYRFVQETLTNVARHAAAERVWITLGYDCNTVQISVRDDGRGFDARDIREGSKLPSGIGLLGLQERIELLGGHLQIVSHPGAGTMVTAFVPVEEIT